MLDPRPSPVCPLDVRWPVMRHRWECLTFLHWAYDPDEVGALLPEGLTVETWDGRAWVGLVPFHMRVAPPGSPSPPWLGRFAETNVRTYVRDGEGRSGVWFLSLDAERLAAVVAARASYRLPYYWARMTVRRDGDRVRYASVRRWPAPPARSAVAVDVGAAYRAEELTDLDHFLTARWRLFSVVAGRLAHSDAEHPPWPLRRATVAVLSDSLVTAAGLPAPRGEPLVHFSDGVDVRISGPRDAGRAR